jgi:hypothetical protein
MVHIDISEDKQYTLNLEHDLQAIVVDYLRQTDLLFCASLGGYLETPQKRIKSWVDGYCAGQPDLLIYSPSGDDKYKGLAIELKRPNGTGNVSPKQAFEVESGWHQ